MEIEVRPPPPQQIGLQALASPATRHTVTLTKVSLGHLPSPPSSLFSLAYVWTSNGGAACSGGDWALLTQHMTETCHEVSIDTAINKWYVVCSVGDLGMTDDTPPSETLCHRISAPIQDSSYRCFRCAPNELHDLARWLSWQHQAPIIIPRDLDSKLFAGCDSDSLTHADFDQCRNLLLSSLRPRSTQDMYLCLAALYFVSVGLRRLTENELAAAVRWFLQTCMSAEEQFDSRRVTGDALLKMCGDLLRRHSDSTIVFQHQHMAKFLRSVKIPGFEHGHSIVTELCFQQLNDAGAMILIRPWHVFCEWSENLDQWPLLEYAARYWSIHYRLAVEDQPGLTADLLRMINEALTGHDPSATAVLLQRKAVTAGLAVAKAYDLPHLTRLYTNMGALHGYHLNSMPSYEEWDSMELEYRIDCSFAPYGRKECECQGSDELTAHFSLLEVGAGNQRPPSRFSHTGDQHMQQSSDTTDYKDSSWIFV